ncbi:exported hypothetical protein [Verrucomicrobia bacterium]|nr:exported hypothetical protein [Verrucomicrobiota bacterium]
MRKIISSLLMPAALLAGCAVGPDYHQPKVSSPAQWSTPLAAGETNTAITTTQWWKTFHDAELDSLINRAVSSNLDLRLAQARVREARATQIDVAARHIAQKREA